MQSFLDKGRLSSLLQAMPVHVILDSTAALKGAAAYTEAFILKCATGTPSGVTRVTVTVHLIHLRATRLRPALQRRQTTAAASLQIGEEGRGADRPSRPCAAAPSPRRPRPLREGRRSARTVGGPGRGRSTGLRRAPAGRGRSTTANPRRGRRAAPAPDWDYCDACINPQRIASSATAHRLFAQLASGRRDGDGSFE